MYHNNRNGKRGKRERRSLRDEEERGKGKGCYLISRKGRG